MALEQKTSHEYDGEHRASRAHLVPELPPYLRSQVFDPLVDYTEIQQ